MTQGSLRTALLGRLRRADDDRGSIAMLMLVILVSSCIGALLLATLISQNQSTRFASTRVQTLQSAQSGIDVMLGQIRKATSTDTNGVTGGDADKLPCGPLTGSANATGTTNYTVSVAYYLIDPATAGAAVMQCSAGGGPYSLSTGNHTPHFALITSTGTTTGTGGSKSRTVSATYTLQTDDRNIAGGQFQLYSSTLCMDGGSAQPASGALVTVQTCSTSIPIAASQAFAYRTDLSIQLVSSVNSTYPAGLCLDTATAAHQSGSQVVLKPCNALGTAAWNQQWSFDDYGHLRGAQQGTPSPGLDSWVLSAGASVGQPLVLSGSDNSTSSSTQTWVPAPNAGAGGAGSPNNEIVNFQNFSNCIDVTGLDVNTPYLILYSCKQSPNTGNISWNQKFTPALGPNSATALPVTGTLSTTTGGQTYCIQSPGPPGGGYVTVSTACTTRWTWSQTKDANGATLPYGSVYTIKDQNGYCLSPGPGNDKLGNSYFKIIVTGCTGATNQKWNADPSVLASRLANLAEK